MHQTLKRVFASVLAICFVFSCFNIPPNDSVSALTFENYEYRYINNDTEVEIVKYLGISDWADIPAYIDGKPVTSIGERAFYAYSDLLSPNYSITGVTIPETVTYIGVNAFDRCTKITEVIIPSSVELIDDGAFASCYNLSLVTLNEGLVHIGSGVFSNCNIISIDLPDSLVSVKNAAFAGCSNLQSVHIPAGLVVIEGSPFYGSGLAAFTVSGMNPVFTVIDGVLFNKNQTELLLYPPKRADSAYNVPNDVIAIGDHAFYDNWYVQSISLPSGLLTIGERAFSSCLALTSINLPTTLQSLGEEALSRTTSLKQVTLPSSIDAIPDSLFNLSGLTSIKLPDSITTIGDGAFSQCYDLESVELPDSLTHIGASVFYDCFNLQRLDLPDSVVSIGSGAFSRSGLIQIDLPEALTTISSYLFSGCSSLIAVTIPENVSTIENYAFYGCSLMQSFFVYPLTAPALTGTGWTGWSYHFTSVPSSAKLYVQDGATGYDVDPWTRFVSPNAFIPPVLRPSTYVLKVVNADYGSPVADAIITCRDSSGQISYTTTTSPQGTAILWLQGNVVSQMSVERQNFTEVQQTNITLVQSESYTVLLSQILKEESFSHLNISTEEAHIQGPPVKFMWSNFYMLDTKISLKLPLGTELTIKEDTLNEEVNVIFGIKESATTDLDASKSIIDLIKKVEKNNDKNAFVELMSLTKPQEVSTIFKASGSIAGYAKFSYASGNLEFIEGGFLAKASISSSWEQRLSIPIFYFKLKLQADFEGKLILYYDEAKVIDIGGSISFDLIPSIEVGAGIDEAHVAGGWKVELKNKIDLTGNSIEEMLTIDIFGQFYFEVVLFSYIYEDSTNFDGLRLYPELGVAPASLTMMSSSIELTDPDRFTPLDRDYLSASAGLQSLSMGVQSFEIEGSCQYDDQKINVYPYGKPQLVAFPDGRQLLLWIDDDGTKTDENRTSLFYSVFDGDNWSPAQVLHETGHAVEMPRLIQTGDKAYLVWQKASVIFEPGATVQDWTADMDLYLSVFDSHSNTFSDPTVLTTPGSGVYAFKHALAVNGDDISVVWVENDENDPFMVTGLNSIYRRSLVDGIWQPVVCLADQLIAVNSLAVDYWDDVPVVAYSNEPDYETDGDIEVFLVEGTAVRQLTQNEVDDKQVMFLNGTLYWYAGGSLIALAQDDLAPSIIKDDCPPYFRLLHNGSELAMLSVLEQNFTSQILVSYHNAIADSWSYPVPLTGSDQYIRSFSALMQPDGSIDLAMSVANLKDTYLPTESPYDTTDMVVIKSAERNDLAVDPVLRYDIAAVIPEGNITLTVDLYNNSLHPLTEVSYVLIDENDMTVATGTESVEINSGEMVELNISYQLPADLAGHTVTLQVTTADFIEADLTNNEAAASFAYADLILENVMIEQLSEGASIYGSIRNVGFDEATGITVTLYEKGLAGTEIAWSEVIDLAIEGTVGFQFTVPESYFEFKHEADTKTFHVEVSTDTSELYLINNSAVVAVDPVPVAGIELISASSALYVGQALPLFVAIQPVEASNKAVSWISDNTEVATVDAEGIVSGHKAGVVRITAITADGAYAVSWTLTVQNLAVQFYPENGTGNFNVTAVYNTTLTEPEPPVQDDFTFIGWYEDLQANLKFDFSEPVTSSLILYAKWIRETGEIRPSMGQLLAGTTPESPQTSIRFVTTIDSLLYKETGFVVSVLNDEPVINGYRCVTRSTTTVYTAISAGGNWVTAEDLGGVYIVALSLNNIPNAAFGQDIYVRPYVQYLDGTIAYGSKRTFSVGRFFSP